MDIYSLGVVFYELYNLFHTFMERANSIKQLRCTGTLPQTLWNQWPRVAAIVEKMVSRNPSHRPSASSLVAESEINAEKSEKRLLKEHIDVLEAKNSELEAELSELRRKYAKLHHENNPSSASHSNDRDAV